MMASLDERDDRRQLRRRRLRLPALGDVLDGEQDRRAAIVRLQQPPRVEQHRALADVLELVLHLVVVELVVARQHLLEQPAQLGDVPLAVAQLVQQPAFGLLARDAEAAVERLARRPHAQLGVEHEQRLAHRRDDALGVLVGALEQLDVDQHHDHAVDPVVERAVRAQPQRVAAAAPVAHLDARGGSPCRAPRRAAARGRAGRRARA